MSAGVKVLLQNNLDCSQRIQEYTHGLSKEPFLASPQIQDAVVRRTEIIGEAVTNLPAEWKDAHPRVPWHEIARMRDILIHRYFSVDLDLTWQTAQRDIPELERETVALLDEMA
jgi:uncharacterized protein with HEPN domain